MFIMKKAILLVSFLVGICFLITGQISKLNTTVASKDKITFTWYGGSFKLSATMGEPFTVNWGDGNIETFVCDSNAPILGLSHAYETDGEYLVTIEATNNNCRITSFDTERRLLSLDVSGCSALTFLTCYNGAITHLALTGCTALTVLDLMRNRLTHLDLSDCINLLTLNCLNNELTNLDLSNCSNLISLDCSNNKLTNLNLSCCTALERIYCDMNQLQLSDLFEIQLKKPYYISLGEQNLLPQTAIIGEELFSEQSVFDGIFTKYSITKDNVPTFESDYTVVDGKLIFNALGAYSVTMTNTAIGSSARVIVPIEILPVNIRENAVSNIKVYPNPTTSVLIVKNEERRIENIEIYDVFGRKQQSNIGQSDIVYQIVDISHLPTGTFFLNIDGETFKIIKIEK